ncbi:hypothetical protein ACLVWQ_24235 [Streptomyces sp. CWNU-52B]|uniref:hypothetical protein n=1 Tax=unclassified Streptomyces TaxID=2593676 RepID=UPI0039C2B925
MGSLRLTLCSGVVAAAVLTPAAYAADGGIRVTPAPVPGSDVQLRVRGCSGMSGTAASEAFVADAQLTGKPGTLTGETRVRSTLDPGTYDVKVTCDGFEDKVKGTVTVVDRKQREKREKQEKQARERAQREKEKRRQEQQAQKRRDQQKQRQDEDAAATPAKSTPAESASPAAPASPVAPVHAGGGGTARLADAETRSEGPGTRHAVVGLVLASVAAVAVAVSSARRGRRRTD